MGIIILQVFHKVFPRRARQARNFATNVPKILDLKPVFRTDIFRKLTLGAPDRMFYLFLFNF